MTEYAAGQLYLDSGDVLWIAKTAGSAPTWAGVQGLCTVATTTGPPTSGYWSKGQQYVDADNVSYVCTASGTPGTWEKIAYGGDSGWITPALNSGYVQSTTNVQYRKQGNVVRLHGTFTTAASSGTLFTLPSGYEPYETNSGSASYVASVSGSGESAVVVQSTGAVVWYPGTGTASSGVSLDGITWTVD